ncbi:protein CUSTOS [Sceloporus undulatus]|uniref:protein CUSTOS n=1 Tax=Sceloporus undulatus TaxID=8520 RepID=UPI001C4C01EC|nr:protein CUSTOS [Sceloporus undulatus]
MAAAAATKKKKPRLSESSSEEDAEALQRMREAAWNPTIGVPAKSSPPSEEPSLRGVAKLHEDDGNAFQTTAGFRAHVAKKLAVILDRSIDVWERPPQTVQNGGEESDAEEDGFRLFSSSIPGDAGELKPSPSSAQKKWQQQSHSSSSSDEEWQRCHEAAVSAADVLKNSGVSGAIGKIVQSDDLGPSALFSKQKKKKRTKKPRENSVEERAVETSRKDLGAVPGSVEDGTTPDAPRQTKGKEKQKKVGAKIGTKTVF